MLSTKHPNENQTDRYLLTTYFWSYRETSKFTACRPCLEVSQTTHALLSM